MLINAQKLEGDLVEIVFQDDGKGIPSTLHRKVFDPFFTTKMGEGGTGLGLNLVYNITVKILGGTLSLESEEGQGTRFIVTIPKVAPISDEAQG